MPGLSRCDKSGTAFAQDKMGVMGKVFLALAVLIILVIVGGGLFLAYAPAMTPTQKVEKVLPDARFPR
jgi:carbon starvation protein CstA